MVFIVFVSESLWSVSVFVLFINGCVFEGLKIVWIVFVFEILLIGVEVVCVLI